MNLKETSSTQTQRAADLPSCRLWRLWIGGGCRSRRETPGGALASSLCMLEHSGTEKKKNCSWAINMCRFSQTNTLHHLISVRGISEWGFTCQSHPAAAVLCQRHCGEVESVPEDTHTTTLHQTQSSQFSRITATLNWNTCRIFVPWLKPVRLDTLQPLLQELLWSLSGETQGTKAEIKTASLRLDDLRNKKHFRI